MIKKHRAFAAAFGLIAAFSFGPSTTSAFEVTQPQEAHTIRLNVGGGVLATTPLPFESIFVADETVADVMVRSDTAVYVTARGAGRTSIFGLDKDDRVIFAAPVEVTQDISAMRTVLQQIAPGSRISISQVGKALVLSGQVEKQTQIDALGKMAASFVGSEDHVVNRVELMPATQVRLQVRIAEVSRTLDEEIGLNWGALGQVNATVTGLRSDQISVFDPPLVIDNLLQVLAQEGLVTVLAEPNLSARSGETATFLAGGEFPYELKDEGETSIEFKEFGASLAFTPEVNRDGRIGLKVAAEVSDLNFLREAEIPALSSRRVETSVDLRAGESLAIAGLMTNTSSQNIARLPGFGSIPVIGALFRSTGFQKGKTELVVIVTPYIVQPSLNAEPLTPLDRFTPPNDAERLLLGRLEGAAKIGDGLKGSVGFSWKN